VISVVCGNELLAKSKIKFIVSRMWLLTQDVTCNWQTMAAVQPVGPWDGSMIGEQRWTFLSRVRGKAMLSIGLKFLVEISQGLRLRIQKTPFKLELKPYLKAQVKFYCPQTVV